MTGNHGTTSSSATEGLFRTRLAGSYARTTEAFQALRQGKPLAALSTGMGSELYGGRIPVSDDLAEGEWELLSIRDEIYVNTSRCHYARQRTECVLPEDFVELHFMVAGATSVDFSETGQISIASPYLTVVRQGDDARYTVACGPGVWRSVGIHVSRAYLLRFLEVSVGPDSKVLAELNTVSSQQIFCQQMPMGVEALQAVEQLISNPYSGYRRLLYAQAKVYEILCASVDLWQSFIDSNQTADFFSTRDLKLVERVKDLILQDASCVPTIPQLARAVGTNTSKLKRGFKFLYGMTVFEFGHRYRMNQALRLLIRDRLSVNEVASAVGYQHQTSFTASFRDFFGFAPKDARRMTHPGDLHMKLTPETRALLTEHQGAAG